MYSTVQYTLLYVLCAVVHRLHECMQPYQASQLQFTIDHLPLQLVCSFTIRKLNIQKLLALVLIFYLFFIFLYFFQSWRHFAIISVAPYIHSSTVRAFGYQHALVHYSFIRTIPGTISCCAVGFNYWDCIHWWPCICTFSCFLEFMQPFGRRCRLIHN